MDELPNALESINATTRRAEGEQTKVLPESAVENILETENLLQSANKTHGKSQHIGPYKLLQKIGEGGMGIVWMAEQEWPIRRRVALKLIKSGIDSKEVVARFEAERQALAMMDHQHIAKVLDANTTEDGRPYFVMELVQGVAFNKYCDVNKLTVNERLKLFIPVCHAVQHAHQKGIIHRDLKPSNILVTLYDGLPVAKVIDFGLAKALQHQSKLTDKTLFTEFGQVVGTLQYMSPEQAEMNALDVDTRTDIYSLGVMFYELLTGDTPIDKESLQHQAIFKTLETIRETEPPRPSIRLSASRDKVVGISSQRQIDPKKLGDILRGDLDWIAMKALEKNRIRRYASAASFAEDIQRFLDGDVIEARPPSTTYLIQKFVKKNQRLALSLAAIGLVLTLATIVSTWFGIAASFARQEALLAEKNAVIEKDHANQARVEAEKQQRVANEQKRMADQLASEKTVLANDAQRSAALAEARYFMSKQDLRSAWQRLSQANQIGLRFADRLVLDEFYQAARSQWRLIDQIPTSSILVTFVDIGSTSAIAYCEGQKFVFRRDDGNQISSLELADRPLELMDAGAGRLVARCRNSVLLIRLLPDLQLIQTRQFDTEIHKVVASDKSLLIATTDSKLTLVDLELLADQAIWEWKDLLCDFPLDERTKVFLSPDDKYILLHHAPWTTRGVIIDRDTSPSTTRKLGEGQLRLGATGQLTFNKKFPGRCFGWFSPSASGGLDDQLWSMDLKTGDVDFFGRADSSRTKLQKQMRLDDEGYFTLIGSVGIAYSNFEYDESLVQTIRYDALWPFDEVSPSFVAVSADANHVVLNVSEGLLVFQFAPSNKYECDNWCTSVAAKGVFSLDNRDDPLLRFHPFKSDESGWLLRPQWLESEDTTWFPWGIDVTADQRHAVILAQETDGSDSVSSRYFRKRAVLYEIDGAIDNSANWKIVRQFDLASLSRQHGFSNKMIKLSPGGKSLLFHYEDGLYRYDCGTDQLIAKESFATWCSPSSDRTQFVVGDSKVGIRVFKMESAEPTLVVNLPQTKGGCISEDGKQLYVSIQGREIACVDLTDGSLLWKKPSRLIPLLWHPIESVFVGLMPEDSGRGGSFVLADQNSMERLAILSELADKRSQVALSQDGKSVYFDMHRWQYGIANFSTFEMLDNRLKTVRGINRIDVSRKNSVEVEKISTNGMAAESNKPAVVTPLITEHELDNLFGSEATIEGKIVNVLLTRARNAANVFVDIGLNDPILIWVPPNMFAEMEILNQPDALIERRIRVTGIVGKYGGFDESFKLMRQITLKDRAEFEVIEPSTAAISPDSTN